MLTKLIKWVTTLKLAKKLWRRRPPDNQEKP